jgi:hypothetical protein
MLPAVALLLVSAGVASANQMLIFVSVGDILNAASTRFTNCNAGMTDCGVYAVGFFGSTGGTAGLTLGSSGGTRYLSPAPSGSALWAPATVAGTSGFEAGGTSNGATNEQLMTNNTATAGNFYNANLGLNSLQGLGAFSASTQIGFLLDFGASIAAGTTNVSLRLFATGLDPTTGAQDTLKNQADVVTISGVALQPVPEPATTGLVCAGLILCGLAARRRRKISS